MPLNPWFDGGDKTKATQRERSFRVKRNYPKILRNRKRRIQRRLDPERDWSDQAEPIMKASNIHYEMAEKARAVNCGGLGAIHLMVNKLGCGRRSTPGCICLRSTFLIMRATMC